MKKENLSRRITVAEMAPHVHSFLPNENKVDRLVEWLSNWIIENLRMGKIRVYDLLPLKSDLACHVGVSQGTMQNAFRRLEDLGIVESKQRIGTYIKSQNKLSKIEKLTSKRELAVELIKKYLKDNKYREGELLVSSRKLAQDLNLPITTLRVALSTLALNNVLGKVDGRYMVVNLPKKYFDIKVETLVEKIADNIKNYINNNLSPGDKLPTNEELSIKFKVSIKTVHDAIRYLAKEGLVYTRRGRYGTVVLSQDNRLVESYQYEIIEKKLREYMISNCKVGDKLPSIKSFSKIFNSSEKTIKKALDNMADDGYLMFSRGRYGGTFVLDLPQTANEAYKWLAINSDYIPSMPN